MKIVYDDQIFLAQKYGGISRYFVEIAKELKKAGCEVNIAAKASYNYYLEEAFPHTSILQRLLKIRYIARIPKLINRLCLKRAMADKNTIVHPTFYDTEILDEKRGKLVCTIHDMIHELCPKELVGAEKVIAQKKRYIYESDHIVAVSENTKNDILKIYPDIPRDKITVIYHGCNEVKLGKAPADLGDYILFVGKRDNYKNFRGLVEAVNIINKECTRKVKVICAGGGIFTVDEQAIFDNNFVQKDCSDEELAMLYSNAKCFVFPSLYEGFGIPILEAFTYGCPMILSDASCFREIAGDAALYYRPDNNKDLADRIIDIYKNSDLRNALIAKGFERKKLYSWEKSAQKLQQVYEKVLKEQ